MANPAMVRQNAAAQIFHHDFGFAPRGAFGAACSSWISNEAKSVLPSFGWSSAPTARMDGSDKRLERCKVTTEKRVDE
eukprot:3136701-Pyramimonas_sp.AAC.2